MPAQAMLVVSTENSHFQEDRGSSAGSTSSSDAWMAVDDADTDPLARPRSAPIDIPAATKRRGLPAGREWTTWEGSPIPRRKFRAGEQQPPPQPRIRSRPRQRGRPQPPRRPKPPPAPLETAAASLPVRPPHRDWSQRSPRARRDFSMRNQQHAAAAGEAVPAAGEADTRAAPRRPERGGVVPDDSSHPAHLRAAFRRMSAGKEAIRGALEDTSHPAALQAAFRRMSGGEPAQQERL